MGTADQAPRLTARQQRFAEEYLVDLNATQAASRAGYSPKTAEQQGYRLLRNVQVSRAIASAMEARRKRTGITQERVLAELELLAFSDITHYDVDPVTGQVLLTDGAPEGAHRAISRVKYKARTIGHGDEQTVEREVELSFWDKPSAVKLAGRHTAIPGFFDKMEITGAGGGPIAVRNVRSSDEKRARVAQLAAAAQARVEAIASVGAPPPKSE